MALELVTLFGIAYATDSHLPGISPMAAVSIFIDGTKDILPTNDSQAPDRMKGALNGDFDQGKLYKSEPGYGGNVFIDYPREFGVMTGLGSHTYEESRGIAADKTEAAIRDAIKQNPNDPVYVVGFSQGANAASDVLAKLEKENIDTSNVTFVLLGNGARNDGGLWARLPAGVYVPLIGLRFGASTNPSAKPADQAAKVIQISKQYDGASDVPKYVLNPLAWANVALGFMSVHNGYYNEVDMDLSGPNDVPDGKIDEYDVEAAEANPDKYIVTKNGNITDIVIKAPVGELPLTKPLLDLGVPRAVVEALDPLLRAIIETSYDRPTDGKYAATPVHLRLLPGPDQWIEDFHAIAEGWKQTEEKLADLEHEDLAPTPPAPATTMMAEPEVEAEHITPPAPEESRFQSNGASITSVSVPVTQAPLPAPLPAPAPPVAPAPVPPPPPAAPVVQDGAPSGAEILFPESGTTKPQIGVNKTLQQINKAITGTVKTVVGALTPKRSTGTTTTSEPDPPASDPAPSDPSPSTDGGGNETSGTSGSESPAA
ncbi:PE-PPE domain-containing protein [Mycobacterium sp. PS03-16]|uniref:PE-PPE domain-containing protein n=1 Tax=Mycobacterium sp. PS03-16 TaxID=2559611 RepID=UPI001FD7309A|nr:PE-PPE domain-containing protein [Mycobacterium sp. PS03-16]